ncbi:MAG: hypothetical protein COW01_01750 [Bdellovibrionales bacterium CG12_big_fil_rev_8_21_14_0_65_38_15]|nr:MAG: hypothetical protein COW79_00300 [Bdellovibrionales bacterium CG22_combo_CG10-13_8_21_14_all_38_13]PIQ57194.1 MAG: hypothetical protein COW01_01750 [Bdellovibrionales bacterium CG12_big_fil_rev_8_21_14_0_65_38_15]PIR31388.1 MAG: hypothetical protein COV38_00840 [Bdellovibrionales bacterium CG11_big_fil_rev_8_21_14_0_20_38_13]
MLGAVKIPFIHPIFEFVSSHSLGPIPLDIVAHLAVSALIMVLMLKKGVSAQKIIVTVLALAILKEVYDLPRLSNTPAENLKDIFVSMLIPVTYLRSKLLKSSKI